MEDALQSDSRPCLGQWQAFLRHGAALWGALLLGAGIICLIAWNWTGFHPMVKLALLGTVIFACAALPLWRGVQSLAGQAGLLLAGLCVGPLLAVYGQNYLATSQVWQLYRIWALVLLPLAIIAGRLPLWWLAWLMGSLALWLWLGNFGYSMFDLTSWYQWLFPLAQLVLVLGLETALAKRPALLLPLLPLQRSAAFAALAPLTFWLAILAYYTILGWGRCQSENSIVFWLPVAGYGAVLLTGWFWFRFRRHDLPLLTLGLASLACFVFSWVRLFWESWQLNYLFLLGLLLAGLTAACALIIRGWMRAFAADQKQDAAAGTAHFAEQSQTSPWYAQLLLGLGGWVAALLLCAGLALLAFEARIGSAELSVATGLVFVAAGRAGLAFSGVALQQFALALAFCGLNFFLGGLCFMVPAVWQWPLLSLLLWLLSFAFSHSFFRFFLVWSAMEAVTSGCLLAYTVYGIEGCSGLISLFPGFGWFLNAFFGTESEAAMLILLPGIFCAVLALAVAWLWLKPGQSEQEEQRLAPLRWAGMAFLLLHPFSLQVLQYVFWQQGYAPWSALAGGSTPFLGTALVLLALKLSRGYLRAFLLAGTLLLLVLGWYFPSLLLIPAILGWVLGRHAKSRACLAFASLVFGLSLGLFYYTLALTLPVKAALLCATGLVLLIPALLARSGGSGFRPSCSGRALAGLLCMIVLMGLVFGSASRDEALLRQGRRMVLPLAPVDPRAFLLGDYMTLDWALKNQAIAVLKEHNPVPVAGRLVLTLDENDVVQALRLDDGMPLRPEEALLQYRFAGYTLLLLPQALYFQEGEGEKLEQALYGEARVDEKGRVLLRGLLDKDLQPLF